MKFIECNKNAYENLSEKLRSDKNILMKALDYNLEAIKYTKVQIDKSFNKIFKEIYKKEKKKQIFFELFHHLIDDHEFILDIFKEDPQVFASIPKSKLLSDDKFILEIIEFNPNINTKKFIKSKSLCIKILKRNRKLTQHVPKEFFNDMEIYLACRGMYSSILDQRMKIISNISIKYE